MKLLSGEFQESGIKVKFKGETPTTIYQKVTKSGIRYYYSSMGAMLPISLKRINENIFKG